MTARRGTAQVALLGTARYVPNMQYASDMVHGQPVRVSLGTPAASSATAVATATAMNSVANTVVGPSAWISDSPFGRTLMVTISGDPGNAFIVELQGRDYLGQPMSERFTGANGATAVLYGKKAFYGQVSSKIITAAVNAVTAGIGTHTRLGLPYKGDISWAMENGALVGINKRNIDVTAFRDAALAVAGGSVVLIAPCVGYVDAVFGVGAGLGSTNDPVLTVKINGTTVTGLTATIDDNVRGKYSGNPTTRGYTVNNKVVPGDVIEILGSASAAAVSDTVGVTIVPTQFTNPDTTDPATTTTGDPRGLYDCVTVPNAAIEYIVGLMGDNSANASNNGGLHGIKHNTPT